MDRVLILKNGLFLHSLYIFHKHKSFFWLWVLKNTNSRTFILYLFFTVSVRATHMADLRSQLIFPHNSRIKADSVLCNCGIGICPVHLRATPFRGLHLLAGYHEGVHRDNFFFLPNPLYPEFPIFGVQDENDTI